MSQYRRSARDEFVELIGPTSTSVLLAVLAHPGPGGMSVRDIGLATGLSSPSTVHHHLRFLRRWGLVDWDDGKSGTIHARVQVVASG